MWTIAKGSSLEKRNLCQGQRQMTIHDSRKKKVDYKRKTALGLKDCVGKRKHDRKEEQKGQKKL